LDSLEGAAIGGGNHDTALNGLDGVLYGNARCGCTVAVGGSDSAIEASDLVIMSDDLSRIPEAVRTARKTITIAKENIVFAIGIKLAVLALVAFNLAGMWLAVFADVGVAVLAILNSMRTMLGRKKR
jgi:Cd2+/Zn2+-exporting ATPase